MELVDIFDENNNPLNYSLDRNEAHEKKLWHRHASCWIMNENGEILLQQRSFSKSKNPGKWAKTGGHVDSGETPEKAVKREIKEEIGLDVDGSKLVYTDLYKNDKEHEKNYTYGFLYVTNLKEDEFKLQKEEVNTVKYFKIEEIEEEINNGNDSFVFYNWPKESFEEQMKILKEYRNKLER